MPTLPSGTPVHLARTPGARRGLVVVPDIGGLRPLFTEMVDDLAARHQWSVAAFEPWPGREDLTLDERLASVGTLDDAALLADVAAAADALEVEPVAVVGFCMGGMVALKAAADGRFDRAVSFYGMVRVPDALAVPDAWATPSTRWRRGAAPVLLPGRHRGSVGTRPPTPMRSEAAGAEVVRYPGADHGFVHDPSRPAHRADDAADAWARVRGLPRPEARGHRAASGPRL